MAKLYYHPMSQNARKVRMAAHLIGFAIEEMEIVDLMQGGNQAPSYLALNPNGMVPTFVDGDFVLSESNAICQYVCEAKGDEKLWPSDARSRAKVAQWMFWETAHWFPTLFVFFRENMLRKMMGAGPPDEGMLAQGRDQMARFGGVLDAALAKQRFLVGEHATLADIAVGSHLMHAQAAAVPLQSYPNVVQWFGRISALEAWEVTTPKLP